MSLLGAFSYTGAASLGTAVTCIAHGLGITPDVALWIGVDSAGQLSMPVFLLTRGSTMVAFANPNAAGCNGETLIQYCHSIIR